MQIPPPQVPNVAVARVRRPQLVVVGDLAIRDLDGAVEDAVVGVRRRPQARDVDAAAVAVDVRVVGDDAIAQDRLGRRPRQEDVDAAPRVGEGRIVEQDGVPAARDRHVVDRHLQVVVRAVLVDAEDLVVLVVGDGEGAFNDGVRGPVPLDLDVGVDVEVAGGRVGRVARARDGEEDGRAVGGGGEVDDAGRGRGSAGRGRVQLDDGLAQGAVGGGGGDAGAAGAAGRDVVIAVHGERHGTGHPGQDHGPERGRREEREHRDRGPAERRRGVAHGCLPIGRDGSLVSASAQRASREASVEGQEGEHLPAGLRRTCRKGTCACRRVLRRLVLAREITRGRVHPIGPRLSTRLCAGTGPVDRALTPADVPPRRYLSYTVRTMAYPQEWRTPDCISPWA